MPMRIAIDFDDTLVFYSKDLKSHTVNTHLVELCNILLDRGYDIYIVTARCINTKKDSDSQGFVCTIPHGPKGDHILSLVKDGYIPTVEDFCSTHFGENRIAGIFYTNGMLKGETLKNNRIHVLVDDSSSQRNDAIRNGILVYDINQLDQLVNLVQFVEFDLFWNRSN